MTAHFLYRTNAEHLPFVGRCAHCGETQLPLRAACEPCPQSTREAPTRRPRWAARLSPFRPADYAYWGPYGQRRLSPVCPDWLVERYKRNCPSNWRELVKGYGKGQDKIDAKIWADSLRR